MHTHKRTHLTLTPNKDFDEYSIVAFCKNATIMKAGDVELFSEN